MKIWMRWLVALVVITPLALTAGCSTTTHSLAGTTTTLVLTRHGDRDKLAKELNSKGQARAEALVTAVADLDISAIYCPNVKRNIDTAAPLAKQRGLTPKILERGADLVRQLTDTVLTKHSGETVLWVGNQDNLKHIYSLLGGEGEPPVNYGDLYIMTIYDKGKPSVGKRLYGPTD